MKHTRKHERRRKESNQGTELPASGGLSGQTGRTVRKGRADCPHPCRGSSGLSRGLSEKDNRTSKDSPRITDRPRGARGLSARHPRTVRLAHVDHPKLRPNKTRKHRGSKAKSSKNTKDTTTNSAHADRPPPPRGLSALREQTQKQPDLESQHLQFITGSPKL
jgi:hypothetical protein